MVTMEVIITSIAEAPETSMFPLFIFVLLLLGVYIFYISPKKAKEIKEQEQTIQRLKSRITKLKKEVLLLKS